MIKKIDNIPQFNTKRMILRKLNISDAPDFFVYASEPNVGINAGWKPHDSVEESKEVIDFFNSNYGVWGMFLNETGELIGSIGLHQSTRNGIQYDLELGYAMSEKYWGQGLMTEAARRILDFAFNGCNAKVVYVSYFPGNNRSRRVIEKCGFNYVGTLRKSWQNYDGRVLDEEYYLLDKKTWTLFKNHIE